MLSEVIHTFVAMQLYLQRRLSRETSYMPKKFCNTS